MSELTRELDGMVALVTGSARNIGRSTVEELARAGASVTVNSKQARDLCEQVSTGIKADGGQAIVAMGDVRDPVQVNDILTSTFNAFGGVDIIVHNAAVRTNQSIEELKFETLKQMVDLSIHGCFHLAKASIPSMKRRGGGVSLGLEV